LGRQNLAYKDNTRYYINTPGAGVQYTRA